MQPLLDQFRAVANAAPPGPPPPPPPRLNPQGPLPLDYQTNPPPLLAEEQTLIAEQAPAATAVPVGVAYLLASAAKQLPSTAPPGITATEGGTAQAEETPVDTSPRAVSPNTVAPRPIAAEEPVEPSSVWSLPMAGLLAVLPPLDLAAQERGLQRFLEQLEELGAQLVGEPYEQGLWLWTVAGAGAVVACEIARRQVRRSAELAEESNKRPSLPLDPFLAG
jgi:hypothetical protein